MRDGIVGSDRAGWDQRGPNAPKDATDDDRFEELDSDKMIVHPVEDEDEGGRKPNGGSKGGIVTGRAAERASEQAQGGDPEEDGRRKMEDGSVN